MNRIANAVLSFFELVEAEGRELRTQTEILLRRALLLFFGGLLLFASALAAGFALYAALSPLVGRPAAALALAALFALPGLYVLSKGARRKEPAAAETSKNTEESCDVR